MSDDRKRRTGTVTIPIGPESMPILARLSAVTLRLHGNWRRLVIDRIRAGMDPAPDEIAAALKQPIPEDHDERGRQELAELLQYVARAYVLGVPRRKGRKKHPRTLMKDTEIARDYYIAAEAAHEAHEADSRRPRSLDRVKKNIARQHKISVRTLERIVRQFGRVTFS